jgi:hypothetical protein
MKTTDFITENQFIGDDAHAMHQDHEVQMARSDCYSAAKYAIELHKLLKNISEMQGLDGWVSEKLTLANDYLRTVHEYLAHEMSHPEEAMPEMFTAESAEVKFAELLGEGGRLDMSSPEEKAARKAYIKAHGHPPPLTPDSVVAKYNPENDKKIRDYYLRRKGIPQDKLDKMKEDGVAEAGPGDINRLEHRGEEYNVYFNQRKGMYTARGTGQMSGQIQPGWFHTLADAIDHAEMELGDDGEHQGIAESDPLANRDAYAKQHQQGQVYKTHYPKGENPFHKAGMKDKRSTKMSAYDISNTGPKGVLPESDVAEGELTAYQKLLKQMRQTAKNDPNRIPRGYELSAHGQLVKKHKTEKSNDGVGGLGEGLAEAAQGHTIEAHGIRGMDRKAWHKTFKNVDQMNAWAEKYDAEIHGTRDLEQAKRGNLSPAMEGVAEGEKKGLYYNVNKRKAAGTSRPASNPKAPTDQAWKDAAKTAKTEGVSETTSSAGMATAPGVGKGPATGTLFGGSYAPKTPFTGKKKAKTSVIKR